MTEDELRKDVHDVLYNLAKWGDQIDSQELEKATEEILRLVRLDRALETGHTKIHIDESLDQLYPQGWDRQGPSETLTKYFTTHTKEP